MKGSRAQVSLHVLVLGVAVGNVESSSRIRRIF